MDLALNKLLKVDMPLNKETKPTNFILNIVVVRCKHDHRIEIYVFGFQCRSKEVYQRNK